MSEGVQDRKQFFAPEHHNENLFCAIMCKVSGINVDEHHILEIGIMPINAAYKPHDHFPALYLGMALDDDDEYDSSHNGVLSLSKERVANLKLAGINRYSGHSIFTHWWDTLQLRLRNDNKRIYVLSHDWPLQRQFILKWLGHHTYHQSFDVEQYRDLRSIANAMNDREDAKCEKVTFSKTDFHYLRGYTKVEIINDDALAMATMLLPMYHNMLRFF